MANIELVIKIPEEDYKKAIEFGHLDMCGIELAKAVLNGTPLPEGHGKLIDAREYENDIRKHYFDNATVIRCTELALGNAQTIIEADKEDKEPV